MCKLNNIEWIVIKSDKKISKNLGRKINKIRNSSIIDNRIYFWRLKKDFQNEILEILNQYKKQKFEIVGFTDKQFGLSLNFWKGGNFEVFNSNIKKLPLSKKFYWNNDLSELITVTPITKKQFESIIYIN
jgi:hypothetical protein